jgi:YlmC/YmxH family sporulation protein
MFCRIDELRNKQVVCVHSGDVLGYVSDIEIDSQNGKIKSLVIFGKPRVLGLFGSREDIVIPWSDIEVIGTETVLVKNGTQLCNTD